MSIGFHGSLYACFQSPGGVDRDSAYMRAARALYVVCYMQSRLGYFVNLKKSHLKPVSRMVHLGFGICSETLSFWVPDKKKLSFAEVREDILSKGVVLLETMQRFVGKCQSFALVFPAASLFTRECCQFMSTLEDDAESVSLPGPVREEVRFWRFIAFALLPGEILIRQI